MSNLQQSYEEIKALWEQRDLSKSARIEQLERERDEAMMTGHDLAKIEYRDLVSDLEAKLDRAGIDALETILNERGPVFDAMVDAAEDAAGKDVSFNVVVGRAIRAALAVLAIYTRTDKTSGPKY